MLGLESGKIQPYHQSSHSPPLRQSLHFAELPVVTVGDAKDVLDETVSTLHGEIYVSFLSATVHTKDAWLLCRSD